MQIEGSAFKIRAKDFLIVLGDSPTLQKLLQRYSQIMTLQAAQGAACNRVHEVDRRLARWLLMSRDRIQSDVVPLTQEFLAHMLGTRRASVSVAAGVLQRAGLISYSRGQVEIRNVSKLKDTVCECYEIMRKQSLSWQNEAK